MSIKGGMRLASITDCGQRVETVSTVCENLSQKSRQQTNLNLGGVAGSDVGNGPARLLPDSVLGATEQSGERLQSAAVHNDLGLHIVSGDNVSDGTQRWRLNGVRRIPNAKSKVERQIRPIKGQNANQLT